MQTAKTTMSQTVLIMYLYKKVFLFFAILRTQLTGIFHLWEDTMILDPIDTYSITSYVLDSYGCAS